jgi:hypothetical protein
MKAVYPNLELIEYKLTQIINLDLISFPENWDLEGRFMKKEYVTVAHDLVRGSYYVFFGTKLGYNVLQALGRIFKRFKGV